MQSALAGLTAQSDAMDRAADDVARTGAVPPEAEDGATVQISGRARDANQKSQNTDSALTSGLEAAMIDTRIAKYAYIANLKVLQTGAEVEKAAADMLKPKR
jgi:hypothetical protein